MNHLKLTIFSLFNFIYHKNLKIYKALYFFYKDTTDKDEIRHIREVIKPGMTVLDIGANIGFYTRIFSHLVGKEGKVYAFEPDKTNFKYLKRTCQHLKNVYLKNLAVGNTNRNIKLYRSNSLNVDHITYVDGQKRKASTIRCISIDKYLNQKIDFIKIDTQGFEYQIVLGLKNTVKKNKHLIILSEFSPSDLRKARSSAKEYLELLKSYGLKVQFIGNHISEEKTFSLPASKTDYWNLIAKKA